MCFLLYQYPISSRVHNGKTTLLLLYKAINDHHVLFTETKTWLMILGTEYEYKKHRDLLVPFSVCQNL